MTIHTYIHTYNSAMPAVNVTCDIFFALLVSAVTLMFGRARLAEVFENLDQTSDGFIREEDIRRALDTLDIVASDAQIM